MAKARKVVTKEDVIRQDKKRAERLAKKKTEEENIEIVNEIDTDISPVLDDEIIKENTQVNELDTENNPEVNESISVENDTSIDIVPENWSDIFNTNSNETEIPEKKVMPIRYVNVVMGKYLD
jgi:hypothetical protein